MQNEQQLVVPSRYGAIEQVRAFVVQAAKLAGLDDRAVFHLQLAVDEACTNIVEHAYKDDATGEIQVTCGTDLGQDHPYFVIRLEDHGRPFDPDAIPEPDLTPDPERLKIGGVGMHFMRKMMDRIEYRFYPRRNELTMYKRLDREGEMNASDPVWQQLLEQDIWLVGARGRLDRQLVPHLESALNELVAAGHIYLIVDLGQVTYINSSGLRALISTWRVVRQQGGDLRLCGLNRRLVEIFEIVGFDQIFPIHSTLAEAVGLIADSFSER